LWESGRVKISQNLQIFPGQKIAQQFIPADGPHGGPPLNSNVGQENMETKILNRLVFKERMKNAVFLFLFLALVTFSLLYWLKEKAAPVKMFKGEILRLASPIIGRGTEVSPKTGWDNMYLVQLNNKKIVSVEIPDTVPLISGSHIRFSGYENTLGIWKYAYVETINPGNAQQSATAERATGGSGGKVK